MLQLVYPMFEECKGVSVSDSSGRNWSPRAGQMYRASCLSIINITFWIPNWRVNKIASHNSKRFTSGFPRFSSFLKSSSVYNRKQFPSVNRPARPALCSAEAYSSNRRIILTLEIGWMTCVFMFTFLSNLHSTHSTTRTLELFQSRNPPHRLRHQY